MPLDLTTLRKEIETINLEMARLFLRRQDVSAEVAAYKREHGLPVLDRERENAILESMAAVAGPERAASVRCFFQEVMALSRGSQIRDLHPDSPLRRAICAAVALGQGGFPAKEPTVVSVGAPGGYGEQAARRMFPALPKLSFPGRMAEVLKAVREGAANYAVVPLENNQMGTATSVYDTLRQHGLYIVRTALLPVGPADATAFSRYACVAHELEISPDADRVSLLVTLPHEPGTLQRLLAQFAVVGVNLEKISSRPRPGRPHELQFYLTLAAQAASPGFLDLLAYFTSELEICAFLGNYADCDA